VAVSWAPVIIVDQGSPSVVIVQNMAEARTKALQLAARSHIKIH
jgi:hypothetical protein